jgi:hypothetical protein
MQYLLSEEEMAAIRADRQAIQKLPTLEGLENVCKHVATTMIQTMNVNGGGKSDRPHGCVHVKDEHGYTAHYCDRCQMAGICPLPKEWSK